MKKTLQEMTIKDPFMFAAAMSVADHSRKFLSIVLDMEIQKVTIITEKTIVYHPEYHGIRLDVLAVEDGTNRHFNVEMQVRNKKNLPKRSRYYHAQMDMDMLLQGQEYNELPDTYVIFICDFDPLGEKKYRYTISNTCKETGTDVEDGSKTIWLNTAGEHAMNESKSLVAFLQYVRNPDAPIFSQNEDWFVESLKHEIAAIKRDRHWEEKFMLLKEMMADEHEEGRREGKIEGIAEALLQFLSAKGRVPEVLEAAILAEKNQEILLKWIALANSVNSIEEFAERMEH